MPIIVTCDKCKADCSKEMNYTVHLRGEDRLVFCPVCNADLQNQTDNAKSQVIDTFLKQ